MGILDHLSFLNTDFIMEDKEITTYIPQRPPIVMIGKIENVDESGIDTTFLIEKENIFCQKGKFREPGLIENIAQTAAARIGYVCEKEEKEIPIGFIGAIKNLKIHFLPAEGEVIKTRVTIEHVVFNATIITGKIFCRETLAAECEMKIFLKEDETGLK